MARIKSTVIQISTLVYIISFPKNPSFLITVGTIQASLLVTK